jgi:hypothetical protein
VTPPSTTQEFADVTRSIGFAVWQLQALELVAACYLILVHKATPATASEKVQTMFAKTKKKTLGQLFGEIRDSSKGSAAFLPQLERLVDERNWLIHRCHHQNRKDLYSLERRMALINRIEALAAEAWSIAKKFKKAAEEHLISLDISKAERDARTASAAAIYREWTSKPENGAAQIQPG